MGLFGAGCDRSDPAFRDAREALGTFVTITAYGSDEADVRTAIDEAYEAIDAVERALDAHSTDSDVAAFNNGSADAPEDLLTIESAVARLDVGDWFALDLGDVIAEWEFETGGRIPSNDDLAEAAKSGTTDPGGASKGLALDRAIATLRSSAAVDAALISAGSTTVAFGAKPDGEPWRIGVEDPRDPSETLATITATGDVTVSTSGDYQRYFEIDGVRYHHILDPRTGRPARGLRSLTVVGASSGLDSDILSTALFVAGRENAEAYAAEHDLALCLIDEEGRIHVPTGHPEAWSITADQ